MSAFRRRMLVAVCLLSSIFTCVSATQASERESQSVEVTIYQMSESEWNNALNTFKTLVAAEAASYCASNAETCGLASGSGFLFTTTQIGVQKGPTIESKSLKVSVYIDFPTVSVVSGTSSTQFVVNSNAAETILANVRESLESALGHEISYIGDEFFGIDPASDMNKIILPIAFIVLFSIIGVAIGLNMWKKRKEKAEKKKLLKEKRSKKSSRIRPIHTIENDKQTNNLYDSSQDREKAATPKEGATTPQILYEERVAVRTNALPPLPSPEEEKARAAEEKEQEKKERRRKRREKKRQEKEAAGEEYKSGMESESEKSKSESLGHTLVPVEDDGAEVTA